MLKKDIQAKKIKFDQIRKKWDEKQEKWYFSIVDIVSIATNSIDPRNYWKVLKSRLKTKQNELVTKCNQLKLKASDGKFYLTDVGDLYTIIEILKLISPDKILNFKAYALSLGAPKIEKVTSPSKIKIGGEISFKNKKQSYPQVKFTLAEFMNKNSKEIPKEKKSDSPKKSFTKITKMRTI